jgi:ParB family chromosome partitioning protein
MTAADSGLPAAPPPNAPAAKPKGLGRGLDALFSDYATAPVGPPADTPAIPQREIAIELIDRQIGQPRRTFSSDELAQLAASISEKGVLQPILVRPHPRQSGRYEIVAGERRWRASQMAGLSTIPAVVRDLDDATTLEAAIIENVQRVDLNPIEEALSYRDLQERFGRTQAEVADLVGKSRPHVANLLRLLALPQPVQDLVRSGVLSSGHGRALLAAPDPAALADRIVAEQLSVRDTERLASKMSDQAVTEGVKDLSKSQKSAAEPDADSLALAADLSAALSMDVEVRHRGEKGGELRISYRTLAQLDRISRLLSAGHEG